MTEIVRKDGILGGEPRLAGHRISVLQVADMVLEGEYSPEHVADQLGITLAEVHAALSYYYDNPEEMDTFRERHDTLEAKLAERAVSPDHAEH